MLIYFVTCNFAFLWPNFISDVYFAQFFAGEPRIWRDKVFTVWISLVDANRMNGCMQFVRGGHRSGRTLRHTIGTTTRTWYTELDEATMSEELFGGENISNRVATCEVPRGTVIIFPGTTPHRSLNSYSSDIRWSADFRLHGESSAYMSATGRKMDWFYGLKDSLLLLKGGRSVSVDWDDWVALDRSHLQDKETSSVDPVIVGPWM